ncbi:MAG: hypothetical protein ACFFDN_17930 [Candidatus Hodarchaeota archaeon]
MEHLFLDQNQITKIEGLEELELRELSLYNNQITKVECIKNFNIDITLFGNPFISKSDQEDWGREWDDEIL